MNARNPWFRRPPETFWVQAGIGCTTIAWGVYVMVVHAPMSAGPVYDELVAFVPAWAWGRIGAAIGILQLVVALAALRYPSMHAWPRRAAGLLMMLFWEVLSVSMLNSGESSPMAVAAGGIALMNLPVVVLPIFRPR